MAKTIALICAAGIGTRMQSQVPKQYLELEYQDKKQTILEITLNKFLEHPEIDKVIVALNSNDSYFSQLGYDTPKDLFDGNRYLYPTNNAKLYYCQGFGERRHSVLSMLSAAIQLGLSENWKFETETVYTLIHDAVRVGVRHEDISKSLQVAREQLTSLSQIINLVQEGIAENEIEKKVIGSFASSENHNCESFYSILQTFQLNEKDCLDLKQFSNLQTDKREAITLTSDNAIKIQNCLKSKNVTGVILPYQPVVDTLKYRQADNSKFNQRCINRSNIVQAQTRQIVDLVYYYYLLINILLISKDNEFINNMLTPHSRCFIHPLSIFNRITPLQTLTSYSLAQALMFQRMSPNEALLYLTDDSSLVDYFEQRIAFVELGQHNLKITLPQDLALASFFLSQE